MHYASAERAREEQVKTNADIDGTGEVVSPDTLQDEVRRDQFYYRVYVRTDSAELHNKAGQRFPILPGMVASVEIKTGQKSVFDYLIKSLNKVNEALRERQKIEALSSRRGGIGTD